MKSEKELALDELEQAGAYRREADDMYKIGITTCAELGISNVEMAHRLKVSEAAVRMMRKRLGIATKKQMRAGKTAKHSSD